MRRLGWLLTLAACTGPTVGTTTNTSMLTGGDDETTTTQGSGIQTVTGANTTTPADTDQTGGTTGADTTGTTAGGTDSAGSTGSGSTGSTGPVGECGNGIVEGAEECDDGNADDTDECTSQCRPPSCGDAIVQKGEDCDDGNDIDTDDCTNACLVAACGDGVVHEGVEECDDGDLDDSDACLSNCKEAICGDGYTHAGVEACDDAFNDGDYGGCMPGCTKLAPYCGDKIITKIDLDYPKGYEYCDGAGPYMGIGCTNQCLYNFSQVTQLFCAGNCSWGGPSGCDQADADIFCKLKTGKPTAKATSFQRGLPTDAGGFPCPNLGQPVKLDGVDPRINLGPIPEFGLGQTTVFYQLTKILTSHGAPPNSVILGNTLQCTF